MADSSYRIRMLEAFRQRAYWYIIGVAVIFFLFFVQLVNLQFIQGEEYRRRARMNMENYLPVISSRGDMYDRTYRGGAPKVVIASNRPSFNLTTIPAQFTSKKKRDQIISNLCRITGQKPEDLIAEIERRSPWERVLLYEDVDFGTVVKIASFPHIFENIDWEDAPVRVYNHANMFAHLVGYVGSISRIELDKLKESGYRHYHKIGKTGIESRYDLQLKGTDGFIRRIVDARRRIEGEIVGKQPISGKNLVLTLDYQVQHAAHAAMENRRGAVVVMKPDTGEIIALVSKPDFDPNRLISRESSTFFQELLEDGERPFLNRSIQARYPPASSFKIVTAVAGLEVEKMSPETTYRCTGKYTLRGLRDHDFYCHDTHGTLDLVHAIGESCNVYFYQYGYSVGPTNILRYARYLGLGELTGIDIPGEIEGFVPSQSWKRKTFNQPWYDGDTINLSIGQGFLSVTPIAMANLLSGIVNGGIMYKPLVVKEILTHDNREVVRQFVREPLREIPLSPLTIMTIKEGMRNAVTSGTARRLKYLPVPFAGKTGTAQTRSVRDDDASQHAWFIGYGPYGGKPEDSYVVAVLVEHGVAGSAAAVPVAEQIFSTLIEQGYLE